MPRVVIVPKEYVRPTFRVTISCLCALCFVTTVLFAGLFSTFYSEWFRMRRCASRIIATDGAFDQSRHCLRMTPQGVHAADGKCPNECDQLIHDAHRDMGRVARRLYDTVQLCDDCCERSCTSCSSADELRLYQMGCRSRCLGSTTLAQLSSLEQFVIDGWNENKCSVTCEMNFALTTHDSLDSIQPWSEPLEIYVPSEGT